MIKTLLVPATGGDTDDLAFTTALTLARAFAAHIDFLHVRLDPAEVAMAMASEGASGAVVSGLFDRLAADAAGREQQAETFFQGFCRRENLPLREAPPAPPASSGPSARWLRRLGAEPYWVAAYGRAADLLVIARTGSPDDGGLTTIETALLDSGRPLLIPGQIPGPAPLSALPESVVIGWKPTREAAHALAAALPFLERAREVVLLAVGEDSNDPDAEAMARVAEGLAWHGVPAAPLTLPSGPQGAAYTLLAAAAERRALLVIGGYGHNRLKEWIFGGVTRQVLQTASVPVLIAH
jgi:nucleotide-binding universal stress UspA family protein